MREILFRGKRLDNGEWVYGALVPKCLDHPLPAIVIEYAGSPPPVVYSCIVQPKTVGQYTGLTDKNGNRIFEGDILQDIDGGIQAAIFDRGAFVGRYVGYTFNDDEFYNNEVIGNIHDNPELLEGGAAE